VKGRSTFSEVDIHVFLISSGLTLEAMYGDSAPLNSERFGEMTANRTRHHTAPALMMDTKFGDRLNLTEQYVLPIALLDALVLGTFGSTLSVIRRALRLSRNQRLTTSPVQKSVIASARKVHEQPKPSEVRERIRRPKGNPARFTAMKTLSHGKQGHQERIYIHGRDASNENVRPRWTMPPPLKDSHHCDRQI
jgi:hypothetical protein